MTLKTEELGDTPDVDTEMLDAILREDAFGKFAILVLSDWEYIQTANDWQPSEACKKFMTVHDSDPWILECRKAGRQYRATGHVTLEELRQAFRSYLLGGTEWRTGFKWVEIEL